MQSRRTFRHPLRMNTSTSFVMSGRSESSPCTSGIPESRRTISAPRAKYSPFAGLALHRTSGPSTFGASKAWTSPRSRSSKSTRVASNERPRFKISTSLDGRRTRSDAPRVRKALSFRNPHPARTTGAWGRPSPRLRRCWRARRDACGTRQLHEARLHRGRGAATGAPTPPHARHDAIRPPPARDARTARQWTASRAAAAAGSARSAPAWRGRRRVAPRSTPG